MNKKRRLNTPTSVHRTQVKNLRRQMDHYLEQLGYIILDGNCPECSEGDAYYFGSQFDTTAQIIFEKGVWADPENDITPENVINCLEGYLNTVKRLIKDANK
jgi:hypothetical protein